MLVGLELSTHGCYFYEKFMMSLIKKTEETVEINSRFRSSFKVTCFQLKQGKTIYSQLLELKIRFQIYLQQLRLDHCHSALINCDIYY